MIYFMAGYVVGSLWALLVTALIIRHERCTDARKAAKKPPTAQQDGLNTAEDEKERKQRQEEQKRLEKQWDNLMNYTGKKQA